MKLAALDGLKGCSVCMAITSNAAQISDQIHVDTLFRHKLKSGIHVCMRVDTSAMSTNL